MVLSNTMIFSCIQNDDMISHDEEEKLEKGEYMEEMVSSRQLVC